MIKRIMRRILFTILGLVAAIGLFLVMAFLLPHIKIDRDFVETPGGVTIYLYSNGVHTDVCLPVNTSYIDWRKEFTPASFKAVDSTFQYVSIGWGDKGFFLNTPTWADLTFSTAFKAAFALDGSAMHITYEKLEPKPLLGTYQRIVISPKQYQQLIAYIQSSFAMKDGHVDLIHATTYGVNDNFYEARGHYSFLKTCNVWTCGALKAAEIKHPIWSPFQAGVMNGYNNGK